MDAPWPIDPFGSAVNRIMGLLHATPPSRRDLDDQSERDLLITLSVQVEHLRRTVTALTWAVGVLLAGAFPVAILMVLELVAILFLWLRGVS